MVPFIGLPSTDDAEPRPSAWICTMNATPDVTGGIALRFDRFRAHSFNAKGLQRASATVA